MSFWYNNIFLANPPKVATTNGRIWDEDTTYVVPKEEARIFLFTSLGLAFPAYYAYKHQYYSYTLLSILTSGISALYWHKPTYSWRRNLDLVFAKLSFSIYFFTAFFHLKCGDRFHKWAFYAGTPLMLFCYGCSNMNLYPWWMFHLGFHMMVIVQKFLTLDILKNTYSSEKKCPIWNGFD